MSRDKYIFVKLAAYAGLASSCAGGYPSGNAQEKYYCRIIDGGAERGTLTFAFYTSAAPPQLRAVHAATIYSVRGQDDDGLVVCGIRSDSDAPTAPRWNYGTTPAAYHTVGSCPALSPGTYRISIHGAGVGSRHFTIMSDGSFKWLDSSC